ncbi:YlxR family protein [Desulfovibrio sp. PG-178-WT-4]|uniref:YlxR family protein n=2 Tax=Desulfovibrio porci TaxID=2605782 RepID=A0A6L5XI93_9BACT|nr:YlxR family protein [Desulfovibrio porci]MSS26930.1 YlxR family protein [Desulfovibrio porci]
MPKNKAVAGSGGADGRERPETPQGPVRMCVICRRRFAKAELNRHVLTAQGNLSIDAEKTRPGRGWYVCSDPVCEQKFAKYRPGARRGAAVKRGTRGTAGDSLDKGGKHA